MTEREKIMGERAEWSVCQSLIQMNAAVFVRPFKTDAIRLTDIVCAWPVLDGNPSDDTEVVVEFGKNYGDIYHMNIDVKGGLNYPTLDMVLNDPTTCFLIEWKSGSAELATPLSAKNAATTHLALIRMRDDEGHQDGKRPFFLLDIRHVREFYQRYNGTSYVHHLSGENSHCALFNCTKYKEEYGFLYFHFIHEEQRWDVGLHGKKWQASSLRVPGDGLLMYILSREARRERAALANGELQREHLLLSKETAANISFGGDEKALDKQFFAEAERYDAEYAPKKKGQKGTTSKAHE